MIYGSWNIRCNGQKFLLFRAIFCPFSPLTTWKIKTLKKTPGDITILHIFTTNDSHMIYGSWDMARDKCNYFLFWAIFCHFTPTTSRKIKILKKWKKHLEIPSFYICIPKIMIRWCALPEIWCVTEVIVISHFGLFFALLPH